MNRKTLIYTSSSLITALALYLIINRFIKKSMIKEIYDEINGRTGASESKRIQHIIDGISVAKVDDAFNPKFFQIVEKETKRGNPIPAKDAQEKAKNIYSAWGYFDDDESKLYGVLKTTKSKIEISFISFWYYKLYKTDLFSDINYKLSDDEKKIAFSIVEKLPSI